MTNNPWEETTEEVATEEEEEEEFSTLDYPVKEPSSFRDSASYEEEKSYWQDN